MKTVIVAVSLILSATAASAQYYGTGSNPSDHYVRGYTNSHGTYVSPHYQTNPNNTQRDNFNTLGNVNPHTGAIGTRPASR
jgi:hypothetical protein